jgi:hypothetical protein
MSWSWTKWWLGVQTHSHSHEEGTAVPLPPQEAQKIWHGPSDQEWLLDKSLNVLEWSSQSLDLNPIKYLWSYLNIALQQLSPSKLTEYERICREEWEKLPKYSCASLVVSYLRRIEAVFTVKGASTKYWVNGLNTYLTVIFQLDIFYRFANISKKQFLPCHFGVLCVDWWRGKKTI